MFLQSDSYVGGFIQAVNLPSGFLLGSLFFLEPEF